MRLRGQDEIIWSHAVVQLKHIHYFLLLLSSIFITAALYYASKDIPLPYENYWHDKEFNISRKRFSPLDATLSEGVAATDPQHPLHGAYHRKNVRYNYGSHWANYCNMIPLPEGRFLPSLLRLMQLRIDTQVLLRSIVLLCYMTMACMNIARCQKMFFSSSGRSGLAWNLARLSPLLDLTQSAFTSLVLTFSWNVDENLHWLMLDIIKYFGAAFMAHALLYTLYEMMDKKMSGGSKMQFRFVCMLVFFVTVGDTNASILKWYETKPCHTYVPASEGVMEYLCIAAVVFFHLSKLGDFNNMHFVLSCVQDETKIVSNYPDFRPAFAYTNEFDSAEFADYRPFVKRTIDAKY